MNYFERAVHNQLSSYMRNQGLPCDEQSGFQPKHSTCTTLIHVIDYILHNMDEGKLTGAVFLNLKKAFDTVDHLLHKLSCIGVVDTPLK